MSSVASAGWRDEDGHYPLAQSLRYVGKSGVSVLWGSKREGENATWSGAMPLAGNLTLSVSVTDSLGAIGDPTSVPVSVTLRATADWHLWPVTDLFRFRATRVRLLATASQQSYSHQ